MRDRTDTASGVPSKAALGAACVGLSLLLYLLTMPPGLLWGGGDFAKFQTWAALGRIETGFDIFSHALWVVLAHPFTLLPIGDVAWRANLAAAVFAIGALLCTFLAACELTRSRWAALLAAGTLAVSHTFWTYAVMPKVYSLNALLLAACMLLLLRWRARGDLRWLCLFGFFYGLSLLNHLVMATAAAGFGAFVLMTVWSRYTGRQRLLPLAVALISFGVGMIPYLVLMGQSATAGETGGTVASFIGGLAYTATHPLALLTGLGWSVLLGVYQFPITFAVGLLGLRQLWRHDRAAALAIGLVIFGTWAFLMGALDPTAGGVYVWNLHYYLQAYVIFALALAPGFERVLSWRPARLGHRSRLAVIIGGALVLPVLVYIAAPVLARPLMNNMPDFRPLPGRDNLTYVLSPWKQGETGPRTLGDSILAALPQDSVLFADYSIYSILHYMQVIEQARPDVTIINLTGVDQATTIRSYAGQPNLYLADTYRYYDIEAISKDFEIVPAPPIYRLVER